MQYNNQTKYTKMSSATDNNFTCNLCGSSDCRHLFKKNKNEICRCNKCSLLCVYPKPSAQELKRYYSEQMFERVSEKYSYEYLPSEARLVYPEEPNDIKKLRYVRRFIRAGRLLDVGCAYGFFLFQARRYFDVKGLEYSASAVMVAKKLGLDVTEGEINGLRKGSRFDAVTLWDVIEHAANPSEMLAEINKRMNKGGHIFISTGDASAILPKLSLKNWALMIPPLHLYFFSRKTISAILEKNGFTVIDIRYFGKMMDLGWVMFKIADSTGSRLLKYIHHHIKDTWIGRLRFPINTYDIMTVCARKTSDV